MQAYVEAIMLMNSLQLVYNGKPIVNIVDKRYEADLLNMLGGSIYDDILFLVKDSEYVPEVSVYKFIGDSQEKFFIHLDYDHLEFEVDIHAFLTPKDTGWSELKFLPTLKCKSEEKTFVNMKIDISFENCPESEEAKLEGKLKPFKVPETSSRLLCSNKGECKRPADE